VPPVQRSEFPAEHWPQAPAGWQAGNMPPHSSSAVQARHPWRIGSQTGFAPAQTALSRHSTHTPTGV